MLGFIFHIENSYEVSQLVGRFISYFADAHQTLFRSYRYRPESVFSPKVSTIYFQGAFYSLTANADKYLCKKKVSSKLQEFLVTLQFYRRLLKGLNNKFVRSLYYYKSLSFITVLKYDRIMKQRKFVYDKRTITNNLYVINGVNVYNLILPRTTEKE